MSIPDQFDELCEKIPKADSEVTKQQRWEHRVVSILMKHHGLQNQTAQMMHDARSQTGVGHLTFRGFKLLNPTFPVWLEARKVDYLHKIDWLRCINDWTTFAKTGLWKAFQIAEANAPEAHRGQSFGMVFESLKGLSVGIIHNFSGCSGVSIEGRISWHLDVSDETITVEKFDSFLKSAVWTP